jgi:glycosyltransferase involved in cell wall biosynthesis
LEIILVDDGSTDGSENICDEYTRLDSRVVVIHKENGGEASARNTGVLAATGEFIMFIDNDDEYLPDAARLLITVMKNDEVDLAIGGCLEVKSGVTHFATSHLGQFTSKEAARLLLTESCYYGIRYILSFVNAKMFRRDIISKNGIMFDEGFVVGNDTKFISDYLFHASTVYDVFEPIYKYYKFHVSDRVQGMAWYYPDSFFLYTIARDKWIKTAQFEVPEQNAEILNGYYIFLEGLLSAIANERYIENGLLPYLTTLYDETDIVKQGAVLDISSDGRSVSAIQSKIVSYLISHGHLAEVEKLMREIAKSNGMLPASGEYIKSMVKKERVEKLNLDFIEVDGVIENELFLKQLCEIISTISVLRQQLEIQTAHVSGLEAQFEDKNAHINNLENHIKSMNDNNADLASQLNIQATQLEGLQSKLEDKKTHISNLENSIEIMSNNSADLASYLNIQTAQVEGLQSQLATQTAHTDELQTIVDRITSSKSWQITKPLRFLRSIFK